MKKKYWYIIEYWECVLCGRRKEYKERQYTEKPKEWYKRIIRHDDACGEHFL